MRRAAPFAVVAVLLASAFTLLPAQDPAPSATPAPAWEYRVLLLSDAAGEAKGDAEQGKSVEAAFNKLGDEGWEHSGAVGPMAAVFKRPKR